MLTGVIVELSKTVVIIAVELAKILLTVIIIVRWAILGIVAKLRTKTMKAKTTARASLPLLSSNACETLYCQILGTLAVPCGLFSAK